VVNDDGYDWSGSYSYELHGKTWAMENGALTRSIAYGGRGHLNLALRCRILGELDIGYCYVSRWESAFWRSESTCFLYRSQVPALWAAETLVIGLCDPSLLCVPLRARPGPRCREISRRVAMLLT
jgi:hypothetical protein